MNKYPSPIIMTVCAFGCITLGILIAYFGEKYDVRFSSPSSEAGVDLSAPAFTFTSTMDLQRELNRRYPKLKLEVDGVYGVLTRAAHERAIGDQYAKELVVWGME